MNSIDSSFQRLRLVASSAAYKVNFCIMRSICIALAMSIGLFLHAQEGQHPIMSSHDIVDGPAGGEHNVEDMQISKDGGIVYTVQTGSSKTSRKSYRATISADKMRTLVELLDLRDIRALPNNLPSQTHPIDFFWDKSIQIDRPEGIQSVHIENFYPFLNLNGLVYPQALIQLECTLQDIKSTTAKRPKDQDDWCSDLLSRNASATNSHACSDDVAQTRIVEGVGWGAVRLGTNLKIVKTALGEGYPSDKFSDVHFVEYRPLGIEISFNNSDDKVHAIYFYNRQQGSEQFGVFCGQTEKGINWKSTVDDVKSLYGHPAADFMLGNSGRLEFTGIDFRFENGTLVRIGVPGR
ncbi:MAG: hypothetical protein ABSG96_28040 [Terracidiphilus sp.]|jgi:hypothetical protein